jgi:hypothetical protein
VECKKPPVVGQGESLNLYCIILPTSQHGMRNNPSKKSFRENETKNRIPPDSSLGQMSKYWSNNPWTKDKIKQQMIKYCFIYLDSGNHPQAHNFLAKIWGR